MSAGPERPRLGSSPEFDLIGAIAERMEATLASTRSPARIGVGIGDDAAVTVPPGATATTVDALVDGFGFRRRWCPPRAVGRKALAAALSDLAAMGARAGEAYVWLGVPADFDREACLELAAGLAELAVEQGVAVIGGDVTAARRCRSASPRSATPGGRRTWSAARGRSRAWPSASPASSAARPPG